MARKCKQTVTAGFYKELHEKEEFVEKNDQCLVVSGNETDVYEVERLIDKKVKKGHVVYLVLWKGYSKEEATWVPAEDITATAIRLYHDPDPCRRVLMDDISTLRSSLQFSLKSGILRRRKISIPFHRHTFNYLFNDKGEAVKCKPGKLYVRADFPSQYFEDSFFNFYNKFGEGCCVEFPIYMYSHVSYHQKSFYCDKTPRTRGFNETLSLTIVKSFQS
ncbi:PREDICTED: uncharacterized protein LOC109585644 isoform X2 [Amphimedon queenslandica]|uniref:Chromo domain-containing protein n=1 Tax=Amphimedon queenslandica TaxID=400682 RepID=A0A1X7TWA0_AMPQE|nr:PREDICTED: uncharacterized protein LOC109585644 isoform X2 [Amphimedon queenslandica]|eukprot:XP_019857340.1 PREDICTED: uncharacterized protein LOC109585644 isoform X2 [Amphimedon queenslandica]